MLTMAWEFWGHDSHEKTAPFSPIGRQRIKFPPIYLPDDHVTGCRCISETSAAVNDGFILSLATFHEANMAEMFASNDVGPELLCFLS